VQGTTRLQKLVFLAQNGGLDDDPIPDEKGFELFDFDPYNYGPFSKELAQAVDDLADEGLIEKSTARTSSGNSREDYRIDPMREGAASDLISEEQERLLWSVKRLYNDTPLFKLLNEVYADYPSYAENSELDLNSL
jgi:uncharacterized protein YwgA